MKNAGFCHQQASAMMLYVELFSWEWWKEWFTVSILHRDFKNTKHLALDLMEEITKARQALTEYLLVEWIDKQHKKRLDEKHCLQNKIN